MSIPTKLAAARFKTTSDRPYLSAAIWALVPVEAKGLGTLGVDKYWRLYYDPDTIENEWTREQIAGVLYHEISHLLRDHMYRAEDLGVNHDPLTSSRWNIAADCEINDELLSEHIELPKYKDKDGKEITAGCFPKTFGLAENLLAEEYYHLLEDKIQEQTVEIVFEDDSGGDCSGSQGDGSSSSNGDGSGDGSGSSSSGSGSSSKSSTKPGGSSGSGGSGGKRKTVIRVRVQKPGPGTGRCGSSATGKREPWELDAPDDAKGNGKDVPGLSKSESRMLQKEVARRILEDSKSRGDIPAGWKRWAEEQVNPKVDWRRELPTQIRNAVGTVSGMVDYSYRKPSRRQSSFPDVIMPSLKAPCPRVGILIDTSGSMGDKKVVQCIGEVKGVLKSMGIGDRSVTVLFVDAAVHAVNKVFDTKQLVPLGGGGTNMCVGIEHAQKMKPKLDLLIVLTDAETPWPAEPPPEFKMVIGRMGSGTVPDWCKVIDIDVNEM